MALHYLRQSLETPHFLVLNRRLYEFVMYDLSGPTTMNDVRPVQTSLSEMSCELSCIWPTLGLMPMAQGILASVPNKLQEGQIMSQNSG